MRNILCKQAWYAVTQNAASHDSRTINNSLSTLPQGNDGNFDNGVWREAPSTVDIESF